MASSSTLIAPIAACSNNNNRGAAVGAVVPVPKTKLPTLSFISRQHYYYNNNNNKRLGLGFGLGRHVLGGSTVNYNYNHHITRASSEEEAMTTTTTTAIEIEKAGVKIVKNPPESKLTDLGVRSWPKWGCPPSKFPWTYSAKETCYLLKGKVKVYPDGDGSDEAVEIGAGDLVEFPKGMSCTWDVSEEVDKHYNFE